MRFASGVVTSEARAGSHGQCSPVTVGSSWDVRFEFRSNGYDRPTDDVRRLDGNAHGQKIADRGYRLFNAHLQGEQGAALQTFFSTEGWAAIQEVLRKARPEFMGGMTELARSS
jgi:hypothetical protein